AGTGATLEALDAGTGARLYSYTSGGTLFGPPAIANGTVYFGSLDQNVYSLALPATAPPPPPPDPQCPSGWTCQDIGAPAPAGSETAAGGAWSITAGGAGLGGTSDAFRFIAHGVSGDGQITLHASALAASSAGATIGLMLRQSADPGAPFYAVLLQPGNKAVVAYRQAFGGATTTLNTISTASLPLWLLVQRVGDQLSAATSTDGTSFTLIPGTSATLVLPAAALAGVAAASGLNGTAGSATVDSVTTGAVTITPAPVPSASPCPTGWSCADIGNPLLAGDQSLTAGTWTISGAGSDISNYSDQFHYVWQGFAADATVSARVVTQSNTSAKAKAGIMLRQNTDAAAAFYAAFVTPGQGLMVLARSSHGLRAQTLATQAAALPACLRITRSGNTFSTYTSPDGVNWTYLTGTTITLTTSGAMLGGLAITSNATATAGSASLDTVTVAASAPPPPIACPTSWSCADIGFALPAGNEALNGGTWTIQGGGNDIWNTSDQFHYDWQSLLGDGTLSARVISQTNSNVWAKAGVMLRLSTDPGAPYYAVEMTPANGITVQYRAAQAANAVDAANIAGAVPTWLRIGRVGTTYTAYTSADGLSWAQVPNSAATVAGLGGTLLAGLAVASHDGGNLGSATFDNVTLANAAPASGCPTGWVCADIGGPALAGTETVANGVWTVQGAGGDIWGTSDQFHYDGQTLATDGTLTARVTAQGNTSVWAKAGVMLRLSTDPGAPYYAVEMTPSNGVRVQYRAT
ncbi:MAG TPA: PQQ-binding-like beta-propeller repeat protein, partial [Ktedonobacterales bacterium]|nr:PQQ-binding-like beta-propeller repeat protein [Ktedonobacterales bacterium]